MNEPELFGLVLAGGKSARMGQDKAKISWHGKAQQYYLADLLGNLCAEVFISCRADQINTIDPNYQIIVDVENGFGPYDAILAAFQYKSNCAWLVVACDLPLVDLQTLQYLKLHRKAGNIATVFGDAENLPEPLVAIWEPESYQLLNDNDSEKRISLRKLLIKNNAEIIKAPDSGALINVNNPQEAEYIYEILKRNLPDQT